MKNFIVLCLIALCLTHVCVRPVQATEIDCGWDSGKMWDNSKFNEQHGGKKPPEGACPPGDQTLTGSSITAWYWTLTPPKDTTGGRRGANRVVKASGYVGVKGKFAEPDIEEVVDFEDDKGPHQNKPTFYLGVSSAVNSSGGIYFGTVKGVPNAPVGITKTDAGFQWEPVVSTDPENVENSFAGWKIFHRVTISTGYTVGVEKITGSWNIWVNYPARWKQNQLGTTELIYKTANPGYVSLIIRGANIPPGADLGAYSTSLQSNSDGSLNTTAVEVRRVVGLTQSYDSNELKPYPKSNPTTLAIMDGSVVEKLNFSEGYLTKVADLSANSWLPWTSVGSSDGLYPKTKEPESGGEWVIDFAKPNQVDSKGDYTTNYQAENVVIRMGNPKKVEGK